MSLTSEFSPLRTIALLRSAGGAFIAQAGLHAELARVEWAEEKIRIKRTAIAGFIGFISAQCLLMSLGLIALVSSWRTPYEVPVMAAVLLGYLAICVIALYAMTNQSAFSAKTFAVTRQEISADLAMLRSTL